MKRVLALFLCVLMILSALPVMAESNRVEAMGSFQGRLLAAGYDVTYDLTLQNKTGEDQAVQVVFAQYKDKTLSLATPNSVPVKAGESLSQSFTLDNVLSDITEIRAFVFLSEDSVQPLLRSDSLNLRYDSIYNDYAKSNLVTTFGTVPADSEELNQRFPVNETFRTLYQKAYINGASLLAYYDVAPKEIYVSINQLDNESSNVHFTQFRTARVIDPEGNVVCYHDFSAEENPEHAVVMKVPAYTGKPGIWTVSYAGGKGTVDEVTIGVPETEYYGIRGDMFIGFNDKTQTKGDTLDRTWYMYVPESCVGAEAVILCPNNKPEVIPVVKKADGTQMEEFQKADGSRADIEPRLHSKAFVARVEEDDVDTVWSLELKKPVDGGYKNWSEIRNSGNYWPNSGTIAFNAIYLAVAEGLPGLFCPTEAAARKLKGGIAMSADGRTLGGVVQARARDASVQIATNGNLTVTAEFAKEFPDEVKKLGMVGVEALTGGSESGISGVLQACAKQNVNPDDIFLGSLEVTEFATDEERGLTHRDNFENFTYSTGSRDIYTAGDLAANVSLPTKLNGVYGDPALVNHAALALMSHFVEMSPEHLLRGYGMTRRITRDENGNLIPWEGASDYWPCDRIFFTFPNMADAYNLLKDKVTPEVCDIMRDAIILIGDKLANYQANDTNQWTEIIRGHLEIYLATGEERFLRYFERHAASIGNPPVDVSSFGQNSAGAYLERMAPSAQYANQVMHNLLPCYYSYRSLPNRNEEVLEKFESSLERAVRYESLNWMPSNPGGASYSASAVMVKGKNGSYNTSGGTYPNFSYASVGFPVAARFLDLRRDAIAASKTNSGADLLYSMPEAGENLLQRTIFSQDDPIGLYPGSYGYASTRSYEIFTQEEWTTQREKLPVEETDKVWQYDELLAWKKNGMYTMTFYSNPFSTAEYNITGDALAHRGGLPFAVWSEGTGPVVLAQYMNPHDVGLADKQPEAVTYYSGVFVEDGDGVIRSTKATNGTLVSIDDRGYVITQPVGTGLKYKRDENGEIMQDSNGNNLTEIAYGILTYTATYTDDGYSIDVALTPAEDCIKTYKNAHIELPIFTARTGTYYIAEETGRSYSEITQSEDKKTLNYKATFDNSYGSMNIISSTAATFDRASKAYTPFAKNFAQKLIIPFEEDGTVSVRFAIDKEN